MKKVLMLLIAGMIFGNVFCENEEVIPEETINEEVSVEEVAEVVEEVIDESLNNEEEIVEADEATTDKKKIALTIAKYIVSAGVGAGTWYVLNGAFNKAKFRRQESGSNSYVYVVNTLLSIYAADVTNRLLDNVA